MTPTPPLSRRLGPTEEIYWRFDALSPINFGAIINVQGELTSNTLQLALTAIQRRHPLLRMRVEADAKGRPWFVECNNPIPLEVLDRPDTGNWHWLEGALNEPFDTLSGPLMRCALLRHSAHNASIALVFHHAISDGRSAVFLGRDILQSLGQQAQGQDPWLVPLPLLNYFGERVPALDKYSMKTALQTLQASLQFVEDIGIPIGVRHQQREPLALDQQRVMVTPRILDAETLNRLVARARQEGTTLQCVLNAALSLTVAEENPPRFLERIACSQVLDIRQRLEPPIGEDVGCFATGASSLHRLRPDDPFWPLTRKIHHHLQHAIVTPLPFFFPAMHRVLVKLGRSLRINDAKTFSQLIGSLHPEGFAVSNLGRVSIEADHSPVSVTGFGFATNTTVLNYLNTSAASFGGQLLWTFNGSSSLSRERIERIADGAMQRLRDAV